MKLFLAMSLFAAYLGYHLFYEFFGLYNSLSCTGEFEGSDGALFNIYDSFIIHSLFAMFMASLLEFPFSYLPGLKGLPPKHKKCLTQHGAKIQVLHLVRSCWVLLTCDRK